MTEAPNVGDASSEALMGKILDEFLDRVEAGERPSSEEYAQRYPQLATVLRQILPALGLLRWPASSGVSPLEADRSKPGSAIIPEGPLGDYRIVRELGRGGMGIVYEAVQISLGRRVALKVLPFAAALDSRQLQRFKNEAQSAAQLHHQSIVPVYGVGCERGVHYYAMQYIEGQSLAEVVRGLRQLSGKETPDQGVRGQGSEINQEEGVRGRGSGISEDNNALSSQVPKIGASQAEQTGPYSPLTPGTWPLTPHSSPLATTSPVAALSTEGSTRDPGFFRSVAQLGIQAAEALHHAHEMGVIHRDIKPANIMIQHSPSTTHDSTTHHSPLRLWITDFGLAHCQSQAGLTMSGDLLGTLRYMSPEQALAKRVDVDHRTDVYSLGVTLYELLTLEPAFPGHDRQELLRQIAFEEPKSPGRLNHAIPKELETIVLKAIAKNPAERYATAGELGDDLRRFLEDKPIRARRPTLRQRLAKWARRNQPIVWSVGVSTAAILLVAFVSLLVNNVRIANKQTELDQANADLRAANAIKDENLYFHRIALAERELAANHAARANELLDSCWPEEPEKRGWEWHFLKRRIHEEPLLLTGHTMGTVVAYSPNGLRLASAGWDGYVRLWDATTGKCRRTFAGKPLGFYGVGFSPDGRLLAAASWKNGTVTVWDLDANHERILQGPFERAFCVTFSPDRQHLAASGEHKVVVWDLRTDEKIDLCSHEADIMRLAYSPDGERLATASDDETVGIWEVRTGRRLLTLEGHQGQVTDVAFSPDGRYVASASGDRSVRLWDAATGTLVRSLTGHTRDVEAVAFSPDGRRLASGGQDGTVRLWDPETGQEAVTLIGHRAEIRSLAFSPDSRCLASAGIGQVDNAIRIWNATPVANEPPEPLRTLTGTGRPFTCLTFSRDGRLLAAGSTDNTVRVIRPATGEAILTVGSRKVLGGVTSVAFSPDGASLAAVGGEGGAIWDLPAGHERWAQGVTLSPYSLTGVAYSPDGQRLVVGDVGAFAVRILDATSGKQLHLLNGHIGCVNAVAYHPDGRRLAAAYSDQTVRVWDVGSQKQLQKLEGHGGNVTSVAYSFDGQHLASTDNEGLVILWDMKNAQETKKQVIHAHRDVINCVAFNSDGRRLATAGADGAIMIWDTGMGGLLRIIPAGQKEVFAVAFHPDGKILASAGADGTVKIWELASTVRGQ